jgi:MFS family permease
VGIVAPLLLLLMRILQGAAIGGEVPGAWVFVAEHVPEKRIGIACGTLTAGLTVGILLGSVVATLINTSLTPQGIHDGGWRIPSCWAAYLVWWRCICAAGCRRRRFFLRCSSAKRWRRSCR